MGCGGGVIMCAWLRSSQICSISAADLTKLLFSGFQFTVRYYLLKYFEPDEILLPLLHRWTLAALRDTIYSSNYLMRLGTAISLPAHRGVLCWANLPFPPSLSLIFHAGGQWESVPEGSTGLRPVREMRQPAVRVRPGLHQTGPWDQPLQPVQVPPGPAALPGASPRGVQPGHPLLPLHQQPVWGEEEENHRALLLLPGHGRAATQLPPPAELLPPGRPLQVTHGLVTVWSLLHMGLLDTKFTVNLTVCHEVLWVSVYVCE